LLSPGEENDFLGLQKPGTTEVLDLDSLVSNYSEIRMSGSCRDALGTAYVVDDTISDVEEWRRLLAEAKERWLDAPEKRFGEAIGKAIAKELR
jgi:hypothetical protein